MSGVKRHSEGALSMKILSQVDVTDEPSKRRTLYDAQEAAWLESIKDEGDDVYEHRADSD